MCAPFVPHLCPSCAPAPFLKCLTMDQLWKRFGNGAASSASSVCILVHPPPPALVESPSWRMAQQWMAYLLGGFNLPSGELTVCYGKSPFLMDFNGKTHYK